MRCGTAIVGDISNTLVTFDPLTRSALGGVVFNELIRFNSPGSRGALVDRGMRREISTNCRRPISSDERWRRTRRIR